MMTSESQCSMHICADRTEVSNLRIIRDINPRMREFGAAVVGEFGHGGWREDSTYLVNA